MNKLASFIFISLMTFSLFLLSGCVNLTTKTINDPIIGAWKFETPLTLYQNSSGLSYDPANGNNADSIIISYPDYQYQFFENHTLVTKSGPCQVLKCSLDNSSFMEKPARNFMMIGMWNNIGDNNYSIMFTRTMDMEIDPADRRNDTLHLENGYIQITSSVATTDRLVRI
jgi:hypothetical protein